MAGTQWVEAREGTKHPIFNETGLHPLNNSEAQNVKNIKVENLDVENGKHNRVDGEVHKMAHKAKRKNITKSL